MNKTDILLDGLRHQQAHIEDEKAFDDRVMGRIEGVEDYIPRHDRGTPLKSGRLTQQNNSQFSIFNFQFSIYCSCCRQCGTGAAGGALCRAASPACRLCEFDSVQPA